MTTRIVWFQLLDSATVQPYNGTSADKVFVSSSADVADFRDAVKVKNSSILTGITSSQRVVYANKSSFNKRNSTVDEGKEEPLEEDSLIHGFGASKKEALIVIVPTSSNASNKTLGKGNASFIANSVKFYPIILCSCC